MQFFEGYDQQILYANARSGLPIYPDWGFYSRGVLIPQHWQVGANLSLVDSVRGLKLRFSGYFAKRTDSMAYVADFFVNDTIYGRLASERSSYGTVALAGIKQTRTLFHFLRFHGGAELEFGLSPSSQIRFAEYAYDLGDNRLLEYNEFSARGKPRFLAFASAVLGLETVFARRIGFLLEVKSGLGAHLMVKEKAFGMARTSYHVGLNYYLFDYRRKALPRPLPPPPKEDGAPQRPPTPGF